jgi:uncharacterized membrane protein YbhN (UPF0104 family)
MAAADILPQDLEPRSVQRRAAQVALLLAVLALVVVLTPGLDEVRSALSEANGWWLLAGVVLEGLSCVSYVLLFRPVFCRAMSWRSSWEIGLSELAAGSLVPASGASGLAFGAWILHRRGMPGDRIARRSVAFFLIKSSVNFAAVAVLGTVMALGLAGPEVSPWLTAVPAALSVTLIAAVLMIPRLGPGPPPASGDGRVRRAWLAVRRSVTGGVAEAVQIVRERDVLVLVGAVGYWAFDNAVLYATFEAVGGAPPLTIVLMGYLIGQLGGLLPLPGGIGGIDGGLIGTLIVFGAPAATTAAAVFAYRLILFWVPLVVGGTAFLSLRRALLRPVPRPDLSS